MPFLCLIARYFRCQSEVVGLQSVGLRGAAPVTLPVVGVGVEVGLLDDVVADAVAAQIPDSHGTRRVRAVEGDGDVGPMPVGRGDLGGVGGGDLLVVDQGVDPVAVGAAVADTGVDPGSALRDRRFGDPLVVGPGVDVAAVDVKGDGLGVGSEQPPGDGDRPLLVGQRDDSPGGRHNRRLTLSGKHEQHQGRQPQIQWAVGTTASAEKVARIEPLPVVG
jgi:hypothetical protein